MSDNEKQDLPFFFNLFKQFLAPGAWEFACMLSVFKLVSCEPGALLHGAGSEAPKAWEAQNIIN